MGYVWADVWAVRLTVSVVAAGDIEASDNTGRITVVLQNWIKLSEVTPRHTVGIAGDIIRTAVEVSNHGARRVGRPDGWFVRRYDTNPIASQTITMIRPNKRKPSFWSGIQMVSPSTPTTCMCLSNPTHSKATWTMLTRISYLAERNFAVGRGTNTSRRLAGSPVAIVARLTNRSGKPIPEATVELVAVASGENVASVPVANVPPESL